MHSVSDIRRRFELGEYISRDDVRALLDAQSTIGDWVVANLDVDGTGVQLWSQGELSEGWERDHANELAQLAHFIRDGGHRALLAVVHGACMVKFQSVSR